MTVVSAQNVLRKGKLALPSGFARENAIGAAIISFLFGNTTDFITATEPTGCCIELLTWV